MKYGLIPINIPCDRLIIDFALFDRGCILAGMKMDNNHLLLEVYQPDLEFAYTPDGHRNMKRVIWEDSTKTTWYTRDASGNILSTYTQKEKDSTNIFIQETNNIYGSSRVGVFNANKTIVTINGEDSSYLNMSATLVTYTRGRKHYELSNHLSNVQVVLTDKRLPECDEESGMTVSYMAEVISAYDYYPFGSPMEDRTYEFESHGYGFNGMEKDDDFKGQGNAYDFGARIYDSRLGRWLSVDPLSFKYPDLTPYHFVDNSPLLFMDIDGRDHIVSTIQITKYSDGTSITKTYPEKVTAKKVEYEPYKVMEFITNKDGKTELALVTYYRIYHTKTIRTVTIDEYGKTHITEETVKQEIKGKMNQFQAWVAALEYNFSLQGEGETTERGGYSITSTSKEGKTSDPIKSSLPIDGLNIDFIDDLIKYELDRLDGDELDDSYSLGEVKKEKDTIRVTDWKKSIDGNPYSSSKDTIVDKDQKGKGTIKINRGNGVPDNKKDATY